MDSLPKLRTSVLEELLYDIVGSVNTDEMMFSMELENILLSRKNEDLSLDKKIRKTLNSYPGRRFKFIGGILKFRTFMSGEMELWMDAMDALSSPSPLIQRYIDEVEDDAFTDSERGLVQKLKESLQYALEREARVRQRRASQNQAK